MLQVYLAGPSAQMERCKKWRDEILAAPRMNIACDWMGAMEEFEDSETTMAQTMYDDFEGILAADVFWLLRPAEASEAWVELGMAMMLNHLVPRIGIAPTRNHAFRVMISGAGRYSSFGDGLGGIVPGHSVYETDEEAFKVLKTLAMRAWPRP